MFIIYVKEYCFAPFAYCTYYHIIYTFVLLVQILVLVIMGNIAKRYSLILERLNKDGYVKVQELSKLLGVSEVTIRKDLKYLESRKMLHRNHGSASSLVSLTVERHIDEKEKLQQEEKIRIAKEAATLLEPNDKIIIASGTTLLTFATHIKVSFPITVITSALKVSLCLYSDPNIEVIQLGGVLRKTAASVVGHFAENILENIAATKLFIGVDGIDLDYGLTTSNTNEGYINQQMIKVAQKIVVLTDSTKFGQRGFSKICDFNKVHQIITDIHAPDSYVEALRERGIEVTLV